MTRQLRWVLLGVVLVGCGGSGKPTATSAGSATAPIIKDFAFSPSPIRVKAGTTVTWTNKDSTQHTVRADNGTFTSPHLGTGVTFTHTFSTAGTYTYHCAIHDYMKGTVVVR
jgi:plastocyanin